MIDYLEHKYSHKYYHYLYQYIDEGMNYFNNLNNFGNIFRIRFNTFLYAKFLNYVLYVTNAVKL